MKNQGFQRRIQPVLYLIQKEFRQVFRDRDMLRVIFVVPTLQLFLFAYAANTDLRNVTVGVLDDDHSQISHRLVEAFDHSSVFTRGPRVQDPKALQRLLTHGGARVTLWIPRHFQRDLLEGRRPEVAVAVDGRNSGLAGRASAYTQMLIQREIVRLRDEQVPPPPMAPVAFATEPATAPKQATAGIQGVTRFFYNPELESRYYMVPGILVLLITIVSTLLTGMAVVREKEIGTLEQILVTPMTPGQLVAGKTLPFAVIAFGELAFAMTVAVLWFRLPLAGSVVVLALGVALYLLVTLGVGLLASTVSNTQQQAMFTVWFFMVFAILMSGFFYPVENMPDWARMLSQLDPLRYEMTVVRGVFLKGSGIMDLLPELSVLAVMGIAIFSAAVLRFHKRVA